MKYTGTSIESVSQAVFARYLNTRSASGSGARSGRAGIAEADDPGSEEETAGVSVNISAAAPAPSPRFHLNKIEKDAVQKMILHYLLQSARQYFGETLTMRRWKNPVGLNIRGVEKASGLSKKELKRILHARRIYLETSAFNHVFNNFTMDQIRLTRDFQRKKGVIFLTSPILLWEIMLNSDRQRADAMLLAAQALFDPLLLGTPTELSVRYLRHAYPENVVNYSFFTNLPWKNLWSEMTEDFSQTLAYDQSDLMRKTRPFRIISKNLSYIIENQKHNDEIINVSREYVRGVYSFLEQDLAKWHVDDVTAKFVIIYVFLIFIIIADLDGSEANQFWADKGFAGKLDECQITKIFIDYPEIFFRGPILGMAAITALQYRRGSANRGALHDGMHMVYAPYVDAIVSGDDAFLGLANEDPYFRQRVLHLSEIQFTTVNFDDPVLGKSSRR